MRIYLWNADPLKALHGPLPQPLTSLATLVMILKSGCWGLNAVECCHAWYVLVG